MRLRAVDFADYVGADKKQHFDDAKWTIDFDAQTHVIRLVPKFGGPVLLRLAHGCDMYPAEEDAGEPGPARPLPGRPRSR
jgi:hypothetical protein